MNAAPPVVSVYAPGSKALVRGVSLLVVALALLVLLVGFAGSAAAAAGVDSGIQTLGDGTDAANSTPLDDANGTTTVIVRFTPVEEPDELGSSDGDGSEAVSDLREHAAAEQTAFESFADARPGVTVEREFWLANAMLVTVDADAVDTADLLAVANVTRIHENVAIETLDGGVAASASQPAAFRAVPHPPQIDAEPSGTHTAGLRLVDAPTAWERFGTRGAGASVAVIDTGVDPAHRDITVAGWASFDENGTLLSDDRADAVDPDGHGTHVAGTVSGGNASGTHIGVAPDADLYAIDAFGEDGSATFAGVLAAMEHATVENDADVLQMSLGANGTFRGFIAPVRNARATGSIVVTAAGNEGPDTSSGPGNVYDALAVGAVDHDRAVAAFSSGQPINATAAFGAYPDDWPEHYVVPDVTAPGVGVVSAAAGTTDGYVRRQGTSMAAPHVSGIAALAVAATDGRVTDADLQAAIVDTAVHPTGASSPDARYGHGVADAPAAVAAAVEATPPEPEPTESGGGTAEGVEDGVADDAQTNDDIPGFGPLVAVVSLAAAASLVRRTRRGPGDR
ncbi:S8 family serine peptidase [Halorubrum sp. DTA46]|uniref:S8 family serine peptidase n=1 Tax=Halorubrum sp. DTA46 TaxID=3402162 RepID=UPI003AB0BB01